MADLNRAISALKSIPTDITPSYLAYVCNAAMAAGLTEANVKRWNIDADNAASDNFHAFWKSLQLDKTVTKDTLYDIAHEHGWKNGKGNGHGPPTSEYPLDGIFADELPTTYSPPDELIEGILLAGGTSVLYGDTNSGKTFLAIDMACAVTRGVSWMGRRTEPGLVIYLAAESPGSVQRRLQTYQKYHETRIPNFFVVKSPVNFFNGAADIDLVIDLIKIIERKRGMPVRYVIGDTLAKLSAGANENAGQDMGLVVARIDRISAETGAHFQLIHHSGKNAANGARGWSGVKAAMDTEIEITDTPTGNCLEITKQRDLSGKGDRIGFRLDSVIMGLTKWGVPATSCVVLPIDAPVKSVRKRASEASGAVWELLLSRGTGMKKGDVAKHFEDRYHKTTIYRELKHLVDEGKAHETAGIVVANSIN